MKPQLVVLFFLTVTVLIIAASVVGLFFLSLNVVEDYAKKLHQITNATTLVSSLFQATGSAACLVSYLNLNIHKDGIVGFSTEDVKNAFNSFYVNSVEEKPKDVSNIQISQPLSSPEADGTAPFESPKPAKKKGEAPDDSPKKKKGEEPADAELVFQMGGAS